MRKECTPQNPYTLERDEPNARWVHQDVHEVGEQEDGWPCGDIVTYECRTCGKRWKSELPQ